jgi:hypothetical protein
VKVRLNNGEVVVGGRGREAFAGIIRDHVQSSRADDFDIDDSFPSCTTAEHYFTHI